MRFRPRSSPPDQGAAAVEFALLFPIFMVLALGLIAGGTAFSRQINVTQAAREASRYGATVDVSTLPGSDQAARIDSWLRLVDGALQTAAGSQQSPIAGFDYRCVALVQTDATGAPSNLSRYSENGAAGQQGACPSTQSAAIPNTIYAQTVLSRNVQFFVLFINPTLHLDAVSVTPYERSSS